MFIIGLYHKVLIPLPHKIQICTYGQNQINPIKGFRTLGVGNGFPTGRQPLLSDALSCRTAQIDWTFQQGHRTGQAERQQSSGSLAEGHWQGSERPDIQAFFISLGARCKRIRKRPRGVPSPQLYAYKTEKLQELEHLNINGKIDLYYADESHVCTEGYVPYGWQFRNEDVYIPSPKAQRVNIFGMIDRNNRYHGFTTTESIDVDKVVEYLDTFSLNIKKDTFIVLDNASVHRNKKIRELRELWEKRGLFLFYLPPYSPHLNLAETLWRIVKTNHERWGVFSSESTPEEHMCKGRLVLLFPNQWHTYHPDAATGWDEYLYRF